MCFLSVKRSLQSLSGCREGGDTGAWRPWAERGAAPVGRWGPSPRKACWEDCWLFMSLMVPEMAQPAPNPALFWVKDVCLLRRLGEEGVSTRWDQRGCGLCSDGRWGVGTAMGCGFRVPRGPACQQGLWSQQSQDLCGAPHCTGCTPRPGMCGKAFQQGHQVSLPRPRGSA